MKGEKDRFDLLNKKFNNLPFDSVQFFLKKIVSNSRFLKELLFMFLTLLFDIVVITLTNANSIGIKRNYD